MEKTCPFRHNGLQKVSFNLEAKIAIEPKK